MTEGGDGRRDHLLDDIVDGKQQQVTILALIPGFVQHIDLKGEHRQVLPSGYLLLEAKQLDLLHDFGRTALAQKQLMEKRCAPAGWSAEARCGALCLN